MASLFKKLPRLCGPDGWNEDWIIIEYEETGWFGLRNGKAIQSLMAGKDHVQAVKKHFLDLLDDAEIFKIIMARE